MTTLLLKPTGDTLERIAFETDLQISRNGTERRIARRLHPEYRIEQSYNELDGYNENAQAIIEALAGATFELPLHQFTAANGEQLIAGLSATTRKAYRTPAGLIAADTPPAAYSYHTPLANAQLADAVQTKHTSGNYSTIKAAYRLIGFKEHITPLLDPTPLFVFKHNFIDSINDKLDIDAKEFIGDGGGFLGLTRYTKKSRSISITLTSAEEIAAFRAFFFTVQGRAKAWQLADPLTGTLGNYRFAADAIEINYKSPALAEVKASIVKL